MLRLNVNEEKQLTFEVQIGGVNQDQLESKFRVIIGEVEYGFPAVIGRESITVDLPPLNKVVGSKLHEGDEVDVKLEIIADGHFLTPWQDRAKISNPLVVEAKIKDADFVRNPALSTKLVVSEDGARQKVVVEEKKKEELLEEDLTNKIVEKLSEKFENMFKNEQKKNVEEPKEKQEKKEEEKEEKEKTEVESEALERLLNKTIDAFNLNESEKPKKKTITLEEFKKNLKEEDVIRYINNKGTKNPKIQKIIYEQAKVMAKDESPVQVLKEVIKILRKK